MSALTTLNYINVAAYLANVAVTYGIGVAGLFGLPSNTELSEKYQSLVTPTGFTFAIWGVIFVAQAVFTVAQLVPSIAKSPLVQEGVGYSYVAVCISQIAWTLAFANQIIWLALIFMLMILVNLVSIVMSQYDLTASDWKDYFLLKFPFAIHCGWIIAASFVNASVVLVSYKDDADLQFYVALGSLIGVLVVAGFLLTYPLKTDYVIPLVLAWATVSSQVKKFKCTDVDKINFTALNDTHLLCSRWILARSSAFIWSFVTQHNSFW